MVINQIADLVDSKPRNVTRNGTKMEKKKHDNHEKGKKERIPTEALIWLPMFGTFPSIPG